MEQGELEGSPFDHSPDIEILPDDEVDLTLTPQGKHRSFDNDEESLDIKPPQVPNNPVKREKHKHKHKDERKRDRDKDRDRSSRHAHSDRDRDRGKHRDRHEKEKMSSESYEERSAREKEKERERERQRRKEVQELEAEAKRREKSQHERDRLERLERERRKLEREAEREQRDREHREKVRQEQERIAKAEREQERLKKAEREQQRYSKSERDKDRSAKSSRSDRSHRKTEPERDSRRKAHSTRQDVEKRRDKDRQDRHRDRRDDERSRSRSPYERSSKSRYRDEYDSRRHEYKRSEHVEAASPGMEVDDDGDRMLEDVYRNQESSNHGDNKSSSQPVAEEEASSESSSDSGSEDSDTDSDSDSEDSDQSAKSASHSEAADSGDDHDHHHRHPKSKFDDYDDDQVSEVESMRESLPESRHTDDEDYLEETPPPSPIELAPELPVYLPAIQGCRNVEEFHCLNRIEEGTYGVVYRARDNKTDELVALKRLKMEKEKEGFPITSLREINTLLKAQHPNIVTVREIVVGSNMDKIYIVMDYVEHDLKSLMQTMKDPFVIGEVKTLMQQLLRGVAHLHDNWIIHRDLKTSNLLLSHNAILKIGDFGLAREYGSPLKPYTSIVVTLWYRSPELLLGIKEYSTYIDMWSVGCIFAEFLTMKPLFPGKSEIDQLNRIFKELGTPNEKIWPGVSELPVMKKCTFAEYPYNQLRERFNTRLSDKGFDLMNRFLTYDPQRRITAREALQHEYFNESPMPVPPSMFPTWPAKSEQTQRTHGNTPRPPSGGKAYAKLLGDDDEALERGFHIGSQAKTGAASIGFSLKF